MRRVSASGAVVAFVTAPPDRADAIAAALVERGLAACVNVTPGVRSVYRWRGDIEHAEEALLVVKTVRERVAAIEEALRELHPYELFELVALDVAGGHAPYIDWIAEGSRA